MEGTITELAERFASDAQDIADRAQPTADMMELAEEAEKLRERIERGEKLLKELKARQREIEFKLIPEAMQTLGMVGADGKGKFTTKSGGTFYLHNSTHVNVRSGDREKLHEWLRENTLGDLIKETVHPQTLKATVRELIQDGKRSSLPDFINVDDVTTARFRKGKRNE